MRLTRFARHVLLLILGMLWILPLYLVLVNMVASPEEFRTKSVYAPPSNFSLWSNITAAWNAASLGATIGSTLLYAVVGGVLAVFLASLAAFALVNLNVKYGFAWFMLLYAGTIFPFQMYLSPLYSLYVSAHLYNTHFGLLILYTAVAIPFAVFVIRNHFTSIPHDISEAARLDGAGPFRVYAQLFVPLSLNAFATVFILQFTWIWNDLLFGLTLSRSASV
ncbi:MAG: carbohydrate ABC transporter permease, partial [Thermomicrobiales bacterium]